MFGPLAISVVPPTPSTNGLEAGKSACARLPPPWSREPSSPEAQHIVTPFAAAAANAWLAWRIAIAVQALCGSSSGLPYEQEITDGSLVPSVRIAVIASTQPRSVNSVKYIAIFAAGAIP